MTHKRKGVRPNDPTPSHANVFNYLLNLFLPRAARPTKPVPIRIIVADSGTDDIPTLSAKAASGASKKMHTNNAVVLIFLFISIYPLLHINPLPCILDNAKFMQLIYYK
jgi:hypothetical protein